MAVNWKKSPYERLDDILKYPANKIVHAWNWTTGRTKSDLAALLLVCGAGFGLSKPVKNYSESVMLLGALPLGTTVSNFLQDNEETNLRQNALKGLNTESYRWMNRLISIGFGALSVIFSQANLEYKEGGIVYFPVELCYAASYYIMTADSLPPRRSAIAKGIDKLVDIVNSYIRKPAYETNILLCKAPNPSHAY